MGDLSVDRDRAVVRGFGRSFRRPEYDCGTDGVAVMSPAPAALHEIVARSYAGLDPELGSTVARFADAEGIDPRILASLDHSPRRLELYLSFYEELVTGPLGSDRLKKVIRRRVADITDLRERGELGQHAAPEPPAGLAADELALVRFMDAWAIDHQNVDPGIY